ncbi:MAG TPA: hypothetical protein PKW82_09515 [Spirochaetales bacterium]|nr:hypothetical protein [Spirochaetales bacterium]
MCANCGESLPREGKVGFRETCPKCGRDLHTCLHCRFHKVGVHWDCLETVTEQVVEKDRSNLCEWFVADPRFLLKGPGARVDGKGDAARSAFEDLFKG